MYVACIGTLSSMQGRLEGSVACQKNKLLAIYEVKRG